MATYCEQCGTHLQGADRCPACGAATANPTGADTDATPTGANPTGGDGASTDPGADDYPDYLSTGETEYRDPPDWPYYAAVVAFLGCLVALVVGVETQVRPLTVLGVVLFFATPVLVGVDAKTRVDRVGSAPWYAWPFVVLFAYIVGAPLYLAFRYHEDPPAWP